MLVMFVFHGDISAGKRCIGVDIVANGARRMRPWLFADTSQYLPNTNTLSPAGEDIIVLMDATMTDASPRNGQMIW